MGKPVQERIRQNLPAMLGILESVDSDRLPFLAQDLEISARQTAFRRPALQLIENKAFSSQEFYRELARSDDDGKRVAARGLGLATSAEASLNIPLLRELLQSGKTTEKLQELRADLELLSQNPQLPDSIREKARKLLSGN